MARKMRFTGREGTAPLKPVLDALDAPIPGLSDIGAGKVSLLRLAQVVADDTGALPPGVADIIDDVAHILDVIDQLKFGNNNLTVSIGSFDFSTTDSGESWNATDLGAVGGKLVDMIETQVIPKLDPHNDLGLSTALDNFDQEVEALLKNGLHLDFPFVEDPLQSAVQMLLGRNADLITFSGDLISPGGDKQVLTAPLWGPIAFQLTSNVSVNLHFEIGYDTQGILDFANTGKDGDLLDGLYIDASQPLIDVEGGIKGTIDIPHNFGFGVTPYADAELDGFFRLGINDTDPTGQHHVRPFENPTGPFFNVQGSLSAALGLGLEAYLNLGFTEITKSLFSYPLGHWDIIPSSEVPTGNPANPGAILGADPGSTPAAKTVEIDVSSAPTVLFDSVIVYLDGNNSDNLMVDVNGQVTTYSRRETSDLLIKGEAKTTTYEIAVPELPVEVVGKTGFTPDGPSTNTLYIDERGYHSTGKLVYHVTDHSVSRTDAGDSKTAIVSYSDMNNLRLTVSSDDNAINIDSLPSFPVEIVTPAQVKPVSKAHLTAAYLTLTSGLYDFSPNAPKNTITVIADAISNGQQLSIFGHSNNDALIVSDDSTSAPGPLGGPTYEIDPKRLTLSRYAPGSGAMHNQQVIGEIDFTGLKAVTINGLDAGPLDARGQLSNTPVDRAYVVDDWNTDAALAVTGGAGNDKFVLGNGDMDAVSGTPGHERSIAIDGGGGKNTVVFDDSDALNTSYTDTNGNVVTVTTSAPAWQVIGNTIGRTDATTNATTGMNTNYDQSFAPTHIQSIELIGGQNTASFKVLNTAVGALVTILTNHAADPVTVGSPEFGGSVSLGAPLTVEGAGNATLTIDDPFGHSGAQTRQYTVTPTAVNIGAGVIDYSGLLDINLNATLNSSAVAVLGTPVGTALNVSAPGAASVSADFAHLGGALDVTGNAQKTFLYLSSSDTSVAHTQDVTANTVTRDGAPPVTYGGLKELVVEGTVPANVFNVDGTAAGVTTLLDGGYVSHDTFNISPNDHLLDEVMGALILLDRDVSGVTDQATVNFYDDNAIATHTYSVTDASTTTYTGTVLNRSGAAPITTAFSDANLNLYINQDPGTVKVPKPLPVRTVLNIIAGQQVSVDATALGVSTLYVDGAAYAAATPFTARLMAGPHTITTNFSDETPFTVNRDGAISYDPSLEGVLTGAGTKTLTVSGRAVTFDATALGVTNVEIDAIAHVAASPFTVRLLPGQHEIFDNGEDANGFTVNPDGTVAYDPGLEGALTGAGAARLMIIGRSVTINAVPLGESAIEIDALAHDATGPFKLQLLPGQHEIFDNGADAIDFTVNPDGTVAYDASLQGALTGAGTTEIDVAGRAVSFAPTALGAGTVYIDGRAYSGKAAFTVQLLPGQHTVGTAAGLAPDTFTVSNDGTVGYDPSLQGALTGAGTSTLTLVGRNASVDATALQTTTLMVDGVSYDPTVIAMLMLLPGGHYVETDFGTFAFSVNSDGTVAYDPSLDDVFSGSGTTKLTLR
jgi:hypothetical protein